MRVGPRLAALAAAALTLIYAGGIAFAIWQARAAVASSDRQWCATLSLLTARPVPRPTDARANPSREDAFVFYRNLVTLRDRFGC